MSPHDELKSSKGDDEVSFFKQTSSTGTVLILFGSSMTEISPIN
jgi:hypothetical protein